MIVPHDLLQRTRAVVYGMPGEAVKIGAAEKVPPRDRVAEDALKLVSD
jgi:chemotaxis response regulator CheB